MTVEKILARQAAIQQKEFYEKIRNQQQHQRIRQHLMKQQFQKNKNLNYLGQTKARSPLTENTRENGDTCPDSSSYSITPDQVNHLGKTAKRLSDDENAKKRNGQALDESGEAEDLTINLEGDESHDENKSSDESSEFKQTSKSRRVKVINITKSLLILFFNFSQG